MTLLKVVIIMFDLLLSIINKEDCMTLLKVVIIMFDLLLSIIKMFKISL